MNKTFFIILTTCILYMQNTYGQHHTSATDDLIKIGLLISDNRSMAARNGAQLAMSMANEKEGLKDLQFQLVVRSMEGPWGTGSNEAVNLVFKEKVWAILGSHDARNAHLVEQVIAKTNVVFLSAWASDPSLSQAFIPWYFSCVPNDIQQADALIEEIYNKRKINKTAIVLDNYYDSGLALKSLLKKIENEGKPAPQQFFYDNSGQNFKILIEKIAAVDIEGIILIGQPSASFSFIRQLRESSMNQPVFGTLSLLGEGKFEDLELYNYDKVSLVASENWLGSKQSSFQKEFYKKYGKRPGATAAYAFDGMNLLLEAVRRSGSDREKIQDVLHNINYNGVTGSIQFDKNGNRLDAAQLIELNNEILLTFEK